MRHSGFCLPVAGGCAIRWTLNGALGLALMGCLLGTTAASAQTPRDVVSGLRSPMGVAVQPETDAVFVAESGASRVVRIDDGRVVPVVTGFPEGGFGKNRIFQVGPLGLLFLDRSQLLVGEGGQKLGADRLISLKIPDPGKPALAMEDLAGGWASLPALDGEAAEGLFFGLARGNSGVFVTCKGEGARGVSLAKIESEGPDGPVVKLERWKPTGESSEHPTPRAIAVSPDGYVVVGQQGELEAKADSWLTFYSQEGEWLDSFPLGLHDVQGLAYGPRHGRLFAIDFHWSDPSQGGLYKIVATNDDVGCKPVRIATLDSPTAMAFSPNGDLYVTLAGSGQSNEGPPDGKLIVFKQLDVDNSK